MPHGQMPQGQMMAGYSQMAMAPAQFQARPAFQAAILGPQPLDPQPPLAKGQLVLLQGIRSRADLNGKRAKILGYATSEDRWDCELMAAGGGFIKLRAENLLVLSTAGVQTESSRCRV